jgi:hypothetical protein
MHMKFIFCAMAAFLFLALAAPAQTTAFTYQGQLISSNAPATGSYDFRFQIYNASSVVVAGPLTNAPVGVTNGLFTVPLDFGASVFDGSTRSLEIGVRSFNTTTNINTNAYAVLSPRQTLTSVPYAIQSLNAANAVALTAPLQATNLAGTIPNSLLSPNVAVLTNNVVFSGSVTATNFIGNGSGLTNVPGASLVGIITGNGSGLTNVPATSLTGTLPDARLSANVALQSNPNLNFAGTVSATNFTGAGHGLTNVPATSLVGTIPDARLSTNVAMYNATSAIFSSIVTATNFVGNGYGLSNLPATSLIGTIPDAQLSANVALQSNPNLNFAGTVSATNFTGGGHGLTNVPGAFFWVTAAPNTQAKPNVGYICNNDVAPVTITLPSSPSVGDVYKVAGVGAGGWIIKQNANQMIATGNLSDSIGESWTARSISRVWSAVASSADGTKLVATVKGGQIYTSTDSGVTWAAQDSSRNWSSAASSADGAKLVAGVGDKTSSFGYIYTSGNSGIGSWSQHDSTRQWVSVASSADGTKLVAAVYGTLSAGGPGVYTSTSSGASWSRTPLSVQFCSSVASSADGTKLVATVYSGQIWTSIDSGGSWLARDSSRNWTAVASSADGSRLIAAVASGQLYISYDSGTNWTAVNPGATPQWTAVASSADGSRLVAVASTGEVYISTDSGVTWAQHFGLPAASWTGVACSADGSRLVLVANVDRIYTSSQGGTTTGTAGYLIGPQHSAIELIYTGNNLFLPLSHEGTIRAY